MKKILVGLLTMFLLMACGGESSNLEFDEKELLSAEETKEALRNPGENKGKSVEITGFVFNFIDEDKDHIYIQIYQDFNNYKDDVTLKIPTNIAAEVEEDTFVHAQGVILGEMKGENLFGGDLKTSVIEVDNIVTGDFRETVAKTRKDDTINTELTQHGLTVLIEKIEFSDYDTRLYVKINNESDSKTNLYSFDFTLVINGKNYTEDYSYYGEYPEIDSELNPNTSTEGIIAFEAIDYNEVSDVKIIVDSPYSDNWENDFDDYIFEFTLN